ETSLPETVSNDRHRILTRLILLGGEVAAHDRFHTNGIEKVGSDKKSLDSFRRIDAREICTPPTLQRELFERFSLRLPVEIVRNRDFVMHDTTTRHLVPDRNHAIEFWERQRLQ